MVDGEVATWVFVEPIVEFESEVVVNDDEMTICNETFDFPRGYEAVAIHYGGDVVTRGR